MPCSIIKTPLFNCYLIFRLFTFVLFMPPYARCQSEAAVRRYADATSLPRVSAENAR